ncbi:MAG: hypothetical protein GWN07_14975 [Actinobacteria bacterium]|nr:phosphatase PAP2 family protein [Actinomycetota bacterium]NIU66785.1 phosphatase PAP2 family protein [Actinomycetota bacterium]NIW28591.1 hypothetical protein [Actinomycetota bacterium]NIX21063.1 hypothetical protein [Actinomycetota bacterium]
MEVGMCLGFYVVYTAIRNQFGSALGESVKRAAFDNAIKVIDVERAIGLYHEEWIQARFIDWDWFIVFWNVFYGSFHFIVTIYVMVALFLRHPRRYVFMRSTLAATTATALVGFAFFPLMPPRLLSNCASEYGACEPGHEYLDTLVDPGGLWSFESGTMETISNQYAAMPSLHIAWALWCTVGLYPVLRTRWSKGLIALYPVLTLFSIIVTANHYWIDAVGGIAVLALGLTVGQSLSRFLPGGTRTPRPVGDTLDDGP